MAGQPHPLTTRGLGIILSLLACVSGASAQALTATASPLVLLVSSPESAPEEIEGFTTAIRAQLGDAVRVQLYEATPPSNEQVELRSWARALADDADARAVLWLEPGERDTEIALWILIRGPRGDDLQRFYVTEPNDFDRFRSLAIGARSLLGELLDAQPDDAQAVEPHAQPVEPHAQPVEPHAQPVEPHAQPVEPVRPEAPALALHAALGPALRLSSGRAALGVDARVGLRVSTNLSVLLGIDFTREERMSRSDRDRLTIGSLVMGTLPLGRAYLSLGVGGTLVLARLGGAERSSPATELAGSVRLQSAVGLRVFDDLFLELPISLDLRYAGASRATPLVELSVGLMLGFGAP